MVLFFFHFTFFNFTFIGKQDLSVLKLDDNNLFSVCDTLKTYLRSLPEPLLTFTVYDEIVDLMSNFLLFSSINFTYFTIEKDEREDEQLKVRIKEILFENVSKEGLLVLTYLSKFLKQV